MTDFRTLIFLHLAIASVAVSLPSRAQAQWWPVHAPIDYEDCVEKGEKSAESKDAKAALIAQCDAKFAGRRKPGGGYSYFDFMQNRNFDIAGPNPTAEELRIMDEQYTEFLDQRRKTIIAAAFAARQQQIAALSRDQAPADTAAPKKPRPAVDKPRQAAAKPRRPTEKPRTNDKPRPVQMAKYVCDGDPLSCGWSHLSNGITAVKKSLFGPQPKKKQAN